MRERRGRRTLVFVSSSEEEPDELFAVELALEEAPRPEVVRELPVFFEEFASDIKRALLLEGTALLEVLDECTLIFSSSFMTFAPFRGRPRRRGGAPGGGGGGGAARFGKLPRDARSVLFRMRKDRLRRDGPSPSLDSDSESDKDEEAGESERDRTELALRFNEDGDGDGLEGFDDREDVEYFVLFAGARAEDRFTRGGGTSSSPSEEEMTMMSFPPVWDFSVLELLGGTAHGRDVRTLDLVARVLAVSKTTLGDSLIHKIMSSMNLQPRSAWGTKTYPSATVGAMAWRILILRRHILLVFFHCVRFICAFDSTPWVCLAIDFRRNSLLAV